MKKVILFILICFCGVSGTFADRSPYQKVYRQLLTVVDGLVSNEVNCMLQDSKGFMWYGTSNGLCRYDGYAFKIYKSNYLNPVFFTNNNILSLAEDKSNRLWIGTLTGINMIDLRTGKVSEFGTEVPENTSVNAIVVDDNNTVYFGTNTGLYYFNDQANRFYKINSDGKGGKFIPEYIKTLFIDSKNYLWIGRWGAGYAVYNLNTNSFVDYPYLKDKKDLIVNSFFEDTNHNIWLSTWDKYGVWKIENPHQPTQSRLTNFNLQKSEKSTFYPVVYAIRQDESSDDMILATSNGIQIIRQAYKYDGEVEINKSNSVKISSDEIYALYIDRTGLIWYSVYGVGVGALSPNGAQFEQYNLSRFIDVDNWLSSVTAVYEDNDDILWLGIKSFVLGIFNRKDKSFTLYNNHPVLKKISNEANAIYCFHKPWKKDELWLGTRFDGLYVVRFNQGKIISVDKKDIKGIDSKNLAILSVLEDKQSGTMWIATNRGLVRGVYKDGDYIIVHDKMMDEKFRGQAINTLLLDDKGNLWIGTKKMGLFRFYPDKNKHILQQYCFANRGLNNDEVMCLFEDYKNRIWVGTKGGGLSLFDAGTNVFNMIDNMSLMPDDAIYSIEEDNWGNMWLGTGNGLVCYNEDLPYDEKIRIFSGNEGIRINTFNSNASFRNTKNELFFGGSNGFVAFIPDKRENSSFTPQPVITGFSIANEPIEKLSPREQEKISGKQIAYADQLKLVHNQKNIQIEFASLLYENNTAVKYAYQLEGVDKDWVYVDYKKRFVNYNNLPGGTYVFRVKTSNKDGVWCEKPASLTVRIMPAPWKTVYAYIAYLLFFSILFFITFRFVGNQLKLKKMLAIEQVEREKSEEVHQAKMKFFTNISHEFFTPITILKCAIDGMINRYPEDSRMIYTMKANMNRLVRLLEQIIEFRKVETGNLKLKLSRVELVSFIKEICDLHFSPLAAQNNISLGFHSQVDYMDGFVDCDKLDKIMYNLLSNAFKYNREGGSVNVSLNLLTVNRGRKLFITVADTGYGMNEEIKQNIFKRFYEGNFRDFKVKSIGIGLSLTYDLVRFHRGDITVESEEGVGSAFYITLPIDREEYEDKEITFTYMESEYAGKTAESYGAVTTMDDNKLHLLLVEDNVDLLSLMAETMKNDFHILQAENGVEAWTLLNSEDVDVIVTDVFMPEMDGNELTRRLKSVVEFSHIPVIMLSARQDVEHKVEGFDAGADAYITKPFEMPALVANIRSLVRNRKLQAESFSTDHAGFDVSKYTHNNTDKDFLEKVFRIIEDNVLLKNFSTNDLYAEMNMSQSTFYRKLQSLIGTSPNELIRKIKIQVACRLLCEKNLNISEIAYDLGFNDPKYFSNIFRKEMGMSPTEYIRQNC